MGFDFIFAEIKVCQESHLPVRVAQHLHTKHVHPAFLLHLSKSGHTASKATNPFALHPHRHHEIHLTPEALQILYLLFPRKIIAKSHQSNRQFQSQLVVEEAVVLLPCLQKESFL
jgi:hypothetical protein